MKFNADGPEGLINRKAPGQPPRLNDGHHAALAAILESGPIPAVHGVVRWRIVDLCQWIFEEFRVAVSSRTLQPRAAQDGSYRKLSARPRHHAQAAGAIRVQKSLPTRLEEIGREKGVDPSAIELWFADKSRVGQEQDHPPLGQARLAPRAPRATSGPPRPTFSARSVRRKAKAPRSSCRVATPRR